MELSVDVAERDVLVVGNPESARRTVARYTAGGARVVLATTEQARMRLAALADAASAGMAACAPMPDLLVWVTGDPSERAELESAARRLRIWMLDEKPLASMPNGRVTLVGGGPGAPELLTVGGRRALAEADVVLYDRLAPADVLEDLAPGAELIDVGKTPGHHAVPQSEIEAIMVQRALRGLHVVRLKGGDPFVFGRGAEEVLACRAASIPVSVIPGITSAISVPAAAGIPVTHREISRAFTVVSGHVPFNDAELAHLAGLGGTLVVLMGVGTLVQLVAGLQRNGMATSMPIAIIENGFSVHQRTTVSTVSEITGRLGELGIRSPAVIVIGEVVRVPESDDLDHAENHRLVAALAHLAR